ncbi:hypothetical protein [Deinococcus aestuarii]|uniref:hypothetical protein n=1 Tax=Deinococcus aestuarii TaxID=2774531 RepID=UPI001C0C44B6|nr:hypothetical protein [Deinococcus aestuarii]
MDRALFDKTRREVQDELKALGETVVIPDPEDGEYLSTFMAIQRKHPRLAARLIEAEQADPADLLPPPPTRAPRPTWRHRVNHITERLWMRRGLDGKLIWDRNRVLRSGLLTAGVIAGGVLVYSVAVPKPKTVTASTAPATSTGPATASSTDTSGAFPKGAPDPNQAADPATQAKIDTLETEQATGAVTPEQTPSDTAPSPVTASNTSGATPPPPAVFREVDVPTAAASVSPPASTPAPVPDTAPAPVAASTVPFGGQDTSPPVQPFTLADNGAPEPSPAPTRPTPLKTVSAPEYTPPTSDTLFGGDSAPAQVIASPATPPPATVAATPTPAPAPQPEVAPPPAPGQALMYQKPAEAKTTEQVPRSALVYQASAKESGAGADSTVTTTRSALVYQASAQASDTTAGSALSFQQGSEGQAGVTAASARGGAIMYQRSAASPGAAGAPGAATGPTEFGTTAAAPQVDPDAPKFSPTSQIPAKTLTAIRTAAGVAVPLVVVSQDGNWIGTATYNAALGRVDMTFNSFVHMKSGKTYPVQALGYQAVGGNLTQGVAASVHPIAPTLGLDLARAGLNSLNVYTQALQGAGTTTTNGSVTTITRQAPAFVQVLRGELGKLAQLPEDNQTISVVADVPTNTDVIILFGVGASEANR